MNRSRKVRAGQSFFLILSLLVALSMICGTVLAVLPDVRRRSQPTVPPVQPTLTRALPTASPSLMAVSPTPTLVAGPSPLPQPTR